jgi:hypothetical protein
MTWCLIKHGDNFTFKPIIIHSFIDFKFPHLRSLGDAISLNVDVTVTYTGPEFITNFVNVGLNDSELEKGSHVYKAWKTLVSDPVRLWALMQSV